MPERIDLSVGDWRRVSPKYVLVVIASTVITGLVLSAASLFLWLVGGWTFGWLLLAAVVVITVVALVIAPRRARSIGYRLRDDDLLFRRGIMFQRFVSVPYGRMQLIDINRGPVSRMLGLADLKFVTAAASTGVMVPGLPEAEAADLRDRLVELAESRRAGL
jgi:membrane protein YdbS with pleckstrin-like domain